MTHQASVILLLNDWLFSFRKEIIKLAEREGLLPNSITPSPLIRDAYQWFNNDGGVSLNGREPYSMLLANAVLRGYGLRNLGDPTFPVASLRFCAGQFEYTVENCTVKGVPQTCVAAISPLLPHEHSGQPCHSQPVPYRGMSRRLDIYTAKMTTDEVNMSAPYVSSFIFLLRILLFLAFLTS